MEVVQHLFQRFSKVADQGAADASAIHFGYLNACILHKSAVDADLAEFVLDQHQLFAGISLLQKLLDQRGLSGAQKAGENINLRHVLFPSVSMNFLTS